MSSYRVLVAVPDQGLTREIVALLAEEGAGLQLAGTARLTEQLATALTGDGEIDAVLLHEDFGSLAVTDLARQLSADFPDVGLVLIVRHETPELLRSALQAGARGVLALPLTLERVASSVRQAGDWSRSVRERIDGYEETAAAARVAGKVIALAGAKGGVGTTTTAVQLALMAALSGSEHPICLVEMDMQGGDMRTLLDLPYRRSFADLVGVADDVTQRSLEDSLYVHESGLEVLLAPEHGEDAEDVSGVAARQILGALKFRCDLVVIDVGATVTEANAVAVELADQVLVLATPDVLALRAANRLVELWRRLEVRQENVNVVLNRVNRGAEVQPDLARRVCSVPLAKTLVPAGFRDLEPAINSGSPGRLAQGSVQTALRDLALETGAVAPVVRRRRLRLRGAAGQAAVETVGMVTLMGLIILFAWQVVLVGYTFVLADHSARSGARALAVGDDAKAAAMADVPDAWREGLRYSEGEDADEPAGDDDQRERTSTSGDGRRQRTTTTPGATTGRDRGRATTSDDDDDGSDDRFSGEAAGADDLARVQVSLAVPVAMPGLRTPFRVTATESTVIE